MPIIDPVDLDGQLISWLEVNHVNIQLVADHCDVTELTVRGSWLSKRKTTGGLARLRLWHLLQVLGRPSPEMTALQQSYGLPMYVGRLLGLKIIDMQRANEILGIDQDQGVYAMVFGARRPLRPALSLAELQEMHESDVNAAVAKLKVHAPSNASAQLPGVASAQLALSPSDPGVDPKILDISERILRLLPHLRYAQNHLSPEERALLRELTGDGLFQASTLLNGLCSERAKSQGGR